MNRTKFFEILKKRLRLLPKSEINSVLNYYVEYFAEAGEEKSIQELGNPNLIADNLLSNRPDCYTAHELLKEDIIRKVPKWIEHSITFTVKLISLLIFLIFIGLLIWFNLILFQLITMFFHSFIITPFWEDELMIGGVLISLVSLSLFTLIPLILLNKRIYQLVLSLGKQAWGLFKGGLYHV